MKSAQEMFRENATINQWDGIDNPEKLAMDGGTFISIIQPLIDKIAELENEVDFQKTVRASQGSAITKLHTETQSLKNDNQKLRKTIADVRSSAKYLESFDFECIAGPLTGCDSFVQILKLTEPQQKGVTK